MLRGQLEDLSDDVRAKFQAQDVDALAAVYDRYQRAVWSVTRRTTGSDHLAAEAMQDTFIRAWQAAASYDPTRPLGPWLLTIARRTALDLVRREFRPTRGGHEQEQDAVVDAPGIDEAWLSWEVQEALGRLTEDEREIVRLSFFEDLTQPQIAARLNVPVGTVKSRSHRAHRRLAELLAHVRDDSGPAELPPAKSPPPKSPPAALPAENPPQNDGPAKNRDGPSGRTPAGDDSHLNDTHLNDPHLNDPERNEPGRNEGSTRR
jgi:RNA polymerase sigma-70 factor (ECF subfamily)